jgi:formamidopyrimidine-DNA glycosylase
LPELPEVETVRRGLSRLYLGCRLTSLSVTGRRTVRRHPPELLAQLQGQILSSVGRHGKYLFLEWSGGQVLVVHLRMSGQLLAARPRDPLAPHTHAVLRFDRAGELRFVDPRTFGELFVSASPQPPPVELEDLGPDALGASPGLFRSALAGRRAPLKAVLVDQRVLAGVGNIYADEICFAARLRPDRPAGGVRPHELRRLSESARSVLEAAIAAGGSTLRDERYRDVLGEAGQYQLEHKVYGRAGEPCAKCGAPVVRVRIGAKSAYFCPRCQS